MFCFVRLFKITCAIIVLVIAIAACSAQPNLSLNTNNNENTNIQQGESPEAWFASGQRELQQALTQQPNTNRAKNIILLIGDGMGVTTVTAARIFAGQEKGLNGEEHLLAFEKLPYLGLAKTYNTNQQTPDSAGTMTAMVTGVKSKAGFISVNQIPKRGTCVGSEYTLPTFLEQAETSGLATGIVSTARITHATPAATYAHTTERNWEADSNMPASVKTAGCKDIAQQLIDFGYGDGLEVALGGGRAAFITTNVEDGDREDGRDLTQEWAQKENSHYVADRQALAQINPASTDHLLGLFNNSHLSYYHDRLADDATEPTLVEMTSKALDILQKNRQGFFLMVEAGRIDHGHHAGNAYRALKDTVEFSDTVQHILDRVDLNETLIIVTADHSHTLSFAGYPTRGNPILDKVLSNNAEGDTAEQYSLALDGKPYTTLGYRNGSGEFTRDNIRTPPVRSNLSDVDTKHPDYQQQVLVPLSSETHGGEDVAIYAGGPWAHLIQHTHEQHFIYHVMMHAAQLSSR